MNDLWNTVKKAIGKYAADLVPEKGLIGLGSGTTSLAFMKALAERHKKDPLDIQCLPSSNETEAFAKELGLPLINTATWGGYLDVTFDGADLLLSDGTAIKGAGGALLREKIVAVSSAKLILLVDERKWEPSSPPPLPVAIVPFGAQATLREITKLGYKCSIRKTHGKPAVTDDGHWIVDIEVGLAVGSWQEVDELLKKIPGVVETGIFFRMASEGVIGYSDGKIDHQHF